MEGETSEEIATGLNALVVFLYCFPIILEYIYWGLHAIFIQCIVVTWSDIFKAV